ncbi:hypothetical protein QTI33_27380 [Variovorax sp. J22P271]|uniref:hypothetical protein n=1 Tax=Variovorax davisae TaxID=3053515 RepID=UPI002577C940|nr:hypothetical protein [Variovorax sp. J22P271]MDM0035886.1 hypothetical protein [Variovorax sp. J22P271]
MHIESIRAAALSGASLLLAACAAQTPPDTLGGYKPPAIFAGFMSPQASRTGCIDAVARYLKVPRDTVTPTGDQQTMQDGVYVVTLSVAGQARPFHCTVDENGVTSDVVRAP